VEFFDKQKEILLSTYDDPINLDIKQKERLLFTRYLNKIFLILIIYGHLETHFFLFTSIHKILGKEQQYKLRFALRSSVISLHLDNVDYSVKLLQYDQDNNILSNTDSRHQITRSDIYLLFQHFLRCKPEIRILEKLVVRVEPNVKNQAHLSQLSMQSVDAFSFASSLLTPFPIAC
jgi:hypothetical protein